METGAHVDDPNREVEIYKVSAFNIFLHEPSVVCVRYAMNHSHTA